MNGRSCVKGLILCFVLVGCLLNCASGGNADSANKPARNLYVVKKLLYQDGFAEGLGNWVVEQMDGGATEVKDGRLHIDDRAGCTVWFKHKLNSPVMIEYEATPLVADGDNDNCSDLNCFWMAKDPSNPQDIFAASAQRTGSFSDYHTLRTYYVGCGGNRNTTTRFRRYPGTGERPLLPEHDLSDALHLLQANQRVIIQLVVTGNRVQYIRDGEVVFDYVDDQPYSDGWFAFRTVSNHLAIDRFRVYELEIPDDPVQAYISLAGNANTDQETLTILKEMRELDTIDDDLRAQVDRLASEVERYIEEKYLPYFDRDIGGDKVYDFGLPQGSRLEPLTRLYTGRMITWFSNEFGGVWGFADKRREYMDAARGHFEEAHKLFPANRIAAMYLGEMLRPERDYPAPPQAPEWAASQREALERLTDIIEWWIDNRQQENGAYGGGWGDDCEMWRSWVPVMIGFDSPKITNAQAKLSNAIMSQPHMTLGYTEHVSDVQHTSEDSADTVTPMMHLEPDNEEWNKRALRIAELMETLWTGVNERGHLQFKSTYFSSKTVDEDPVRACDTVQNIRAVEPTLLYWQRTGDPKLTRLFTAWLDTWVDATAREERGKPAGVIPCVIHWPDGKVGGVPEEWWNPQHYDVPSIYAWPSAMSFMTQTLALAYHVTGEDKYLQPLRSMAKVRLDYLKSPVDEPAQGTREWCGARMGGLVGALSKHALITGSTEFDDLLSVERSAYVGLRTNGDREPVASGLAGVAYALRYNFEGYTSEVRWTDRVFTFPRLFGANCMYEDRLPQFWRAGTDFLYSTVTGDPGSFGYFPCNAVRWLTPPRDIAALVTNASTSSFRAELFHFGDQPRSMAAELYLLKPGSYRLTTKPVGSDKPTTELEFQVKKNVTKVELTLPPKTLVEVAIEPE